MRAPGHPADPHPAPQLKTMTCRQLVLAAATVLLQVHDDIKDKDYHLFFSWICPGAACRLCGAGVFSDTGLHHIPPAESGNKHANVPEDVAEAAVAAARDELDAEDM